MRFTALILFIFTIFSCGARLKKVSEVNDYGFKTQYSVHPETQMKEGVYKAFDTDGNLYEETFYVKNEIHGVRTLYYPNGNKEVLENFNKGQYQGVFQSFYESGQVKAEGQYENNFAVGEWKAFYESGKLKDVSTFSNNEENGPFTEYYENGNLKAKGVYKDGDNEHGELLLYDEQGQLEKKMDCNLGRCTTTWKKTENKS